VTILGRKFSCTSDGGSESLTKKLVTTPFSTLKKEIAEKTALALLETITGGFIDDYSAPEDLNVTLPTEKATNTAPLHVLIRVFRMFVEFFQRLFGV